MFGVEILSAVITMSIDSMVIVVLAGVLFEVVTVLLLLIAMTRSVFVGELFKVLVAGESVYMTFNFLPSHLRFDRSCLCIGDEVVLEMQIRIECF